MKCANPKCKNEFEPSAKQKVRQPKIGSTCSRSCSGILGKRKQMATLGWSEEEINRFL